VCLVQVLAREREPGGNLDVGGMITYSKARHSTSGCLITSGVGE
jgi:hypothetical protein